MNKRLKLDIINTRNIIRQKLKALKERRAEEEMLLEKSYNPVTKTLQEIATRMKETRNVKKEVKLEPKRETNILRDTSPQTAVQPNFLETDIIAEHEPDNESDENQADETLSVNHALQDMVNHPSFHEYLEQYDALPRQYIEEMITQTDEIDHKYGVHHDPVTEKFKMGDKDLTIDGKDIIIDNIRYEGTPGLYELVFKKLPKGFKQDDEKNYRDMLNRTNAHRRNYSPSEQIAGNRSWKYKNVIAPTLEKRRHNSWAGDIRNKRSGKGLHMNLNNEKTVEYVYWNNTNELVERLRLLLSSTDVGHTNHNNEIVSIIEELNEADILARY